MVYIVTSTKKKYVSLKRDKSPCIKDNTVYRYDLGSSIDCFHRLRLTKQSLELLKKICNKNVLLQSAKSDEEALPILEDVLKLKRKFHDQFYNPYQLDMEDSTPSSFVFYDYEYLYNLTYNHADREIWEIECCRSFYVDMDEPALDMDEAGEVSTVLTLPIMPEYD